MDDPLKGKVFQQPGGETSPIPPEQSIPVQNTPIEEKAPVESSPEQQPQTLVPPIEPIFQQTSEPQATPVGKEPNPAPASPPEGGRGFSIINIAKLLIGLFVVSILIFVTVSFILPNINKKEEKVELTFWDTSDNLAISSVLPDFEKQNPNIKVNVVREDIKDYKDKLLTRAKGGTGPDIFRFHNTWVLQLSDVLLPIPSDIITKDAFGKTFYPVVKHDLVKNGAIYGIPIELDTLSLFVNSKLLKDAGVSAPTNWNDFITSSRALTLKGQTGKIKTAGAGIGTFENVTHAPDIVSTLFVQDSVDLDDISKTKIRVSDALNFYTAFALSDGSVWDKTLEPSILAFSKGNLAMYFGYYKDQSVIKSANSGISFDVVPVPHLAGQNQTMASYFPIGVSLKSKYQKEALKFLQFLSQKDVMQKLTLLPLARVDVPDKTKGQANDAVSSYFSGETFDNGLNTGLNTHLANAIESILSGGNADLAADTLILGFSQVINQFKPAP